VISRHLAQGGSLRAVGRALGQAPSTITREVARNQGRAAYRAASAARLAWRRARRPQHYRLATRPALRRAVAGKLARQWSPQQISGWLRDTFPGDAEMQVSHETIYRSLFIQSRGVLKRALVGHLQRHFRHARTSARVRPTPGQIIDAVSIRQRPADVADRAVPGHWEGDLLEGARGTDVATLVERQSRYVTLARVPNKETRSRHSRPGAANSSIARRAHEVADLGPRERTRRASRVDDRHQRPGLLL
jgi:IS30 family transposase